MLRVLRRVFIIQRFALNGFVLFAEPDVAIHVQRSDMFGKFRNGDRATNLTGYLAGGFPVDQPGRIGTLASRWIIQVVVRSVEAFSEMKSKQCGKVSLQCNTTELVALFYEILVQCGGNKPERGVNFTAFACQRMKD